MPYVEDRTIHDADSHVMELPGTITQYLESRYHDEFESFATRKDPIWVAQMRRQQADPEFRNGAADQLLIRKNHEALGAFLNEDRPRLLDLLGFASQLVFTTEALSNYGLETGSTNELAIATAGAHNRMMADFCSVDRRLLATGYVPLVDIDRAAGIALEAINLGCKAIVISSTCPPDHSPSHIGFDPLWATVEEAGLPILFHVGGEEKMRAAYNNNGLPQVLDFYGGDENFTSTTFMTIPLSVWQTMSVLICDGVLDRHPDLKFGAIELGASWVPSWMRMMDSGVAAFMKGEDRLKRLSAKPSEIVQRQFRVTPYSHEPTGWIIENTGEDVCLFSSDFPHIEGGRNPLKRFDQSLADTSDRLQRKFYRDNFIDLMGTGLASDLHDPVTVPG